jgi:hypothetical protein
MCWQKINSDSLGEYLTSKSTLPEGLSYPISVIAEELNAYW